MSWIIIRNRYCWKGWRSILLLVYVNLIYEQGNSEKRLELEIPVSFRSIRSKGLRQLAVGIHPFVIPDRAYSEELGLLSDRMGSGYRK